MVALANETLWRAVNREARRKTRDLDYQLRRLLDATVSDSDDRRDDRPRDPGGDQCSERGSNSNGG